MLPDTICHQTLDDRTYKDLRMPKDEHVALLNGTAVKLRKPYVIRNGVVRYDRRPVADLVRRLYNRA